MYCKVKELNIKTVTKKLLIFLLFSFLLFYPFSTKVQAQTPHPYFHNYTSEDGLPSSEVHEVFQDSQGYMWFGTDNGLSRYDGYLFKNYNAGEGLLNPVVLDIKEDRQGRLWMLTMSGNMYIMEGDTIYPFRYNHLITKHAEKYFIAKSFQFDKKEKQLYITLLNLGILNISLEQGIAEIIKTAYSSHFVYDNSEIKMIGYTFKENIPYDSKMTLPFSIIGPNEIKKIEIPRLKQLSGYSVQILPNKQFLVQIAGTMTLVKEDELFWTRPLNHYARSSHSVDSTIWLGMQNQQGIRIYKDQEALKNNQFKTVLKGHSISQIFHDRHGGLWVNTTEHGVFYAPQPKNLVYDQTAGMNDDYIKSISPKGENNIMICTWKGSFYEWDMKEHKIMDEFDNPISNRTYNYDIYYSNKFDKTLLGPLSIIMEENKSTVLKNKWYLSTDKRFGMRKISSNTWKDRILINSARNILELDLQTNEVLDVSDKSGKNQIRYLDANYDQHGNKWIGSVNGIWLWKKDRLVRPENMFPILEQRIEAIEFVGELMVLGTKGNGVLIWDQKTTPVSLTTQQGLITDNIENLYVDDIGKIWVGTLKGLNNVVYHNADNINIRTFNKKHGLPGNEITKVRKQGEDIYIATTKGMIRMKTTKDNITTHQPYLQTFLANGQQVDNRNYPRIAYDQNDLEFQFLSLDFKAMGDILYRYRIQDSDNWKYTKNTALNFPNIGDGKYSLSIQAQNEDGYWSKSLTQSFKVMAPFWKRPWFVLTCFCLILGGGFILYSNRLKTYKKRTELKMQLIDLERSALQSQMNPHFIFNVLNAIQSSIIQDKKEEASQNLAKFAKLIRATLSNARAKEITLEEEINYIKSYLQLEKLRHKNKFEFKVTYSPDLDTYAINIPPMLTQPYVENAIIHGMKNIENGRIEVSYTMDKKVLIISVKDNGQGFKEVKKLKGVHQSMSMKITQRRLELLTKSDIIKDAINIEEHEDEHGNILGTEIKIRINV